MKCVIVVDMQKDFVHQNLGTLEAKSIIPNIITELEEYREEGAYLIFTQDTHDANYLNIMEGKKLPVPHCILGTEGWEIIDELAAYTIDADFSHPDLAPYAAEGKIYKPTFGSLDLVNLLYNLEESIDEIVLMGVCTGICVISNTLLLKAAFPNIPIKVVENCCACVSPNTHKTAIEAMKLCHIDII